MNQITFFVPGKPQGKARAKTVRSKKGKVHSFTPDETVNYENLIRHCFLRELKSAEHNYIKTVFAPTTVVIQAKYAINKGTSKVKINKMLTNEIRPTKKPDIDNIAKVVLDALNGLAYVDNNQVVNLSVMKFYSNEPGLSITIKSIS